MKIRLFFFLSLVITSMCASAHPQNKHQHGDRAEWFKEMSRYKAEFIASELNLSNEQKQSFLQLYQDMENSSSKLARETRKLEKEVKKKGDSATDAELEKAAEARASLKSKQGAIEKEYFQKFKKILTSEQLFKLGDAEKEFARKLMESNRKPKFKR
ncbi:MAG: Spy/CpxP family protein refolding chaperone [Paramuribaculum sp.]|nr:Spy/CpxP family protein refolding chaperone [Paramuribaculum sp.]MDE6460991.1 Spy/CpxP family protein refolding chaperone [Paramuribaculum sp.]